MTLLLALDPMLTVTRTLATKNLPILKYYQVQGDKA